MTEKSLFMWQITYLQSDRVEIEWMYQEVLQKWPIL